MTVKLFQYKTVIFIFIISFAKHNDFCKIIAIFVPNILIMYSMEGKDLNRQKLVLAHIERCFVYRVLCRC